MSSIECHALAGTINIFIIPPMLSLLVSLAVIYITLFKSRIKSENILFIILSIWWSLLSPVFICHQLFRGNVEVILHIERTVHFFYVYTPAIALLYCFRITNHKGKRMVIAAFIMSFLFSLTTPTHYYIPSLNEYSWGYMGKGGPAFVAFGVYAASILVYLAFFFVKKIRTEQRRMVRLKLKYIIASFLISGLLSLMNYPAIIGIDIYPPGNFSFIPLSFLAYGVLRYRLLDMRDFIHTAAVWAALSTLLTLPNIIAIYLFFPYISREHYVFMFAAGILWFFINYHYFITVHQFLEKFFNRRKLQLQQIESAFIESIYSLKTFDELINEFRKVIDDTLIFERAELLICSNDYTEPPGFESDRLALSPGLKRWLLNSGTLVESDSVMIMQIKENIKTELLDLFAKYNAKYTLPLVHRDTLIALLMLPEKKGMKPLTPDEMRFIKNVKSAAAISIANSLMYSDLAKLKENLDVKVREKTADLEKSMEALQSVVHTLKKEMQDKVVSYFTRKKLEETISYIDKNFQEEISRDTLARMMNINSDYLGRMFKKLTGKNIADYINECRLKKASDMLINSDDSIIDIAFSVGFESLPTFYRVFRKTMNETPVSYRLKYQKPRP